MGLRHALDIRHAHPHLSACDARDHSFNPARPDRLRAERIGASVLVER